MELPETAPEVCVLIPYFNNLSGLGKAIESIHFSALGLVVLVVDDGSRIPVTAANLADLKVAFKIRIIRMPENGGIAKALNYGLAWIRKNLQPKYIARLDCGDTCTENRFYAQTDFLNKHPHIALLGSWCIFKKPGTSFSYIYSTPLLHPEIVKELHYRNVFIHPTVMFRTQLLAEVGYYPEDYAHAEDYAFFMKIAARFETAILPEVLVTCEINAEGISIANRREQLNGRFRVVSFFGKNYFHRKGGLLKLQLLKQIPYSWILKFKQLKNKPEMDDPDSFR